MTAATKKRIVAVAALVVLAAALLVVWKVFLAKPVEGAKTIYFEVDFSDEARKNESFTIKTDAEYLGDALDEQKLIEGTEGAYGIMVSAVSGVKADDAKRQWWCFYQDDTMLNVGIDSAVIKDGDHFKAVMEIY